MTYLNNDQLAKHAPSIFATQPYEAMTERYKFVPTIQVIELLREKGFQPVRAQQSRSRIPGKAEFTKHMIRFRHDDHVNQLAVVGEEIPELVLVNSHDGTSGYELSAGIYRFVCSNGMVVSSGEIDSVKIRHSGKSYDEFADRIIDGTYTILDETPKVMKQIEQWKNIELSPNQQLSFARAANELKPLPEAISADHLLLTRRYQDRSEANTGKRDLYTTMNVIQENMLRGGLRGRDVESRRRVSTRAIKSVGEDVRLNKALWQLFSAGAENVDAIAV